MSDPMLTMILDMKTDIRKLDDKIDSLLAFKWQMVGGSLAVTFFITCAFELVRFTLRAKGIE